MNTQDDLSRIYNARFTKSLEYRKAVWRRLIDGFFQSWIAPDARVLDLGCGYGEFSNQIRAGERHAMDLNPDAPKFLERDVRFHHQDCSAEWPLADNSLDVVFTSNFFEHLPDKEALGRTLDQILRCLCPGGCLIALGPNIKYLPGTYWDFWDHYVPLTERSLAEATETRGMHTDLCLPKFLPYSMATGWQPPLAIVALYLRIPLAWRFFGRQFLVVARKRKS